MQTATKLRPIMFVSLAWFAVQNLSFICAHLWPTASGFNAAREGWCPGVHFPVLRHLRHFYLESGHPAPARRQSCRSKLKNFPDEFFRIFSTNMNRMVPKTMCFAPEQNRFDRNTVHVCRNNSVLFQSKSVLCKRK